MKKYFRNRLLEGTSTYITGEPSLQAYWRTLLASCTFSPIKRLTPSEILDFGKSFTAVLRGDVAAAELSSENYYPMLDRMDKDWSFALATNGLYLMIQSHVKEGDLIVVLHGAKIPVILRLVEGETVEYNLISTAYVHGFIIGEAMEGVKTGELKEDKFLLV